MRGLLSGCQLCVGSGCGGGILCTLFAALAPANPPLVIDWKPKEQLQQQQQVYWHSRDFLSQWPSNSCFCSNAKCSLVRVSIVVVLLQDYHPELAQKSTCHQDGPKRWMGVKISLYLYQVDNKLNFQTKRHQSKKDELHCGEANEHSLCLPKLTLNNKLMPLAASRFSLGNDGLSIDNGSSKSNHHRHNHNTHKHG